jgi:hypothetical protein
MTGLKIISSAKKPIFHYIVCTIAVAEQKRVILESRVRILRRTCAPLSRERNLLQIDVRMSCVFWYLNSNEIRTDR